MNTPTSIDQDDPAPGLRLAGLVVCAVLICPGPAPGDDPPTQDETSASHTTEKVAITPLLSTDSLASDDWVFVTREKTARLGDTWQVVGTKDEPVLSCTGMPYGYLRTKRQFDDFVMELEWRFPADANGNSGVLLYTADEDKVWPKSIQVQLHQPLAGSIFPSGDATADNEIRDVRDAARPVKEWNVCRISSAGGTLSVEMNGKKIGEVTGCKPSKGWIALQSEGSEVQFRRIRIRETAPIVEPMPRIDSSTSWVPRGSFLIPTMHTICRGVDSLYAQRQYANSSNVVLEESRQGRRGKKWKKASHVVYRDSLAADGHSRRCRHCVWMDVSGTPAVMVDGRSDRLRRSDRRRLDF